MPENLEQIKSFYEEAFEYYKSQPQKQEIDVRFYPYIGINHTIRVRDGKVFVRLAEICREMPLNAQKALAFILVSKLLRKKVPPEARRIYSSFVKTQEIQTKAAENKRAKGRKV